MAKKKTSSPRRVVSVSRDVRAKYDAATVSRENSKHWANADSFDAVRANATDIRMRLRKNARYEVANNSYAKGIVLTLANYLIGTGPRLQMLLDDDGLNSQIEKEFDRWAKAVDLPGKLRTMRMARATDGEAFAMMIENSSMWPISLDLRLIEADQVESPIADYDKYVDGIRFDSYGVPDGYCVLKEHPGGLHIGYNEYHDISSKYMIHWYRSDRPGQIRGIPEITPALPLFAHLRRYTLAVVTTAELIAEFTLFLKTNSPPGGEATALAKDFSEINVERGLMTTLPEGWEPFQLRSEQPGTTYDMFKREILNEIARCLNVPYNIAACNSSSYNYASGRLDHQTFFKSIVIDQSNCESVVVDRVFNVWLDEASKQFGWRTSSRDHQWFWDGLEHVDPAKEANAQATRLSSNTTTLAAEYAKQGRDWEVELRQRAKEIKLCKDLGITTEIKSNNQVDEEDDDEPIQEEEVASRK